MSVRFAHARVREDEHAIGVRLQQALLPAQLLEHPAAQLAARYQTGSDLLYVGGDCAGHPPPLVVSVDGQTDWLEGGRSTPIGSVSLASSRPDASHRLKPSDVLILYSDGLVERRRESISVGLARLEASARTVVDELCERLKDELTTTSTNDDDAVLLSLRFSPVTAQLFQRRIPADARELARTRAAIRSWLRGRRDPASVGHRLLLTVGEALTNAIEHAYDGQRPGVIDLSISDGGDDALHVEVRDHGRWREVVDRPGRGYGGKVIRGLSTGVQRQSGSEGTRLTFSLPIGETSER